jgi:hypothetical protein
MKTPASVFIKIKNKKQYKKNLEKRKKIKQKKKKKLREEVF